jgi:hypothetical protein
MTGTSGSAYMLEGNTSELRNHIGEQVEVTGRIEGSSSMGGGSGASGSGSTSGSTGGGSTSGSTGGTTSGTSSTGSGTSGSTGSSAMNSGSGARLRVESVRTVASTCSSR